MNNSNLPPGVTESMIPGNRHEDLEWERLHDMLDSQFEGFSPEETARALLIGKAAILAERDTIRIMLERSHKDGEYDGREAMRSFNYDLDA